MFTQPTLAQLEAALISSIETQYELVLSDKGKSALRAIAAAWAGQLRMFYLGVADLQKNIFVDTCDSETLLRFGQIKLGRKPFAAVAAQYRIQVTGDIGAVIPALTTFKSDDDALNPGVLYILDSQFTLTATTDFVNVRCLTLGLDGALNDGDTLTPTAPITSVDSNPGSVIVDEEVVEPRAEESTEEYRAVVLASYRLEAQGGAATDYRIWAADAQSVAAVYPYAKSNAPGEINLFVEALAADSTDGHGTPSQAILDDVDDVVNFNPDTTLPLNERGRRPLQVTVNVLPVTPKEVKITITGYADIDATTQALLLTELTSAVNAIRPFIAGADVLEDKNDILDNNRIINVILTARPGAVFTSVSFKVDNVTYTSFTFSGGNIGYLNQTITFN